MKFNLFISKAKKQDKIKKNLFAISNPKETMVNIEKDEVQQKKENMDSKLDTILGNAFSLVDPNEILANIEKIKEEQRIEKAKKAKIIPLFLFPSYGHVVNMVVSIMVMVTAHLNFYNLPTELGEFYYNGETISDCSLKVNHRLLHVGVCNDEVCPLTTEIGMDWRLNPITTNCDSIRVSWNDIDTTKFHSISITLTISNKSNHVELNKLVRSYEKKSGRKLPSTVIAWIRNHSKISNYLGCVEPDIIANNIPNIKLRNLELHNNQLSGNIPNFNVYKKGLTLSSMDFSNMLTPIIYAYNMDTSIIDWNRNNKDTTSKIVTHFFSKESNNNPILDITINSTNDNLAMAIKNKLNQANENDIIVFYYSGHGIPTVKAPNIDNHLSVFQMDSAKMNFLDLKKVFDGCKAKSKLCIIDGNFNINFDDNAELDLDNSSQADVYLGGRSSTSKKKNNIHHPIVIIQSITSLSNTANFRDCFMNAMSGDADKNYDQVITIDELCTYLKEKGVSKDNIDVCAGFTDINVPINYVIKK